MRSRTVHQIPVTVDAFLFVTRPGVNHRPVCQHGAPFIRNIHDVAVAFPALFVFKTRIGLLTLAGMVVKGHVLGEMGEDVLDPVCCFGIKEIEGIMRGGKVTVHAIRHEPLGIVRVGGGLPGIVRELNLMAGRAELGCGSPDHRIIADAEDGKGDDDAPSEKNGSNEIFFHGFSFSASDFTDGTDGTDVSAILLVLTG